MFTQGEYPEPGSHKGSLHDSEMTDAEAADAEGELPSSLEPNLTSPLDFEVSAAVELPLDWPNEYDPALLT